MTARVSGTDSQGVLRLEVTAETSEPSASISGSDINVQEGQIDINGTIEKTGDSALQVDPTLPSGTISYNLAGLERLERKVQNSIDGAFSALGVPRQLVPSGLQTADLETSTIRSRFTSSSTPGDASTFSFGRTETIPPILVPDAPVIQDIMAEEQITLQVQFSPDSFFSRFASLPTVNLDIPASTFVGTVDIEQIELDCESRFNSLDNRIEGLKSDINQSLDRVEGLVQETESLAQEIISRTGANVSTPSIDCPTEGETTTGDAVFGGGGGGTSLTLRDGGPNPLVEITQSELENLGRTELRELKTRVQNLQGRIENPLPSDLSTSNLRSKFQSLRSEATGLQVQDCIDTFTERLENEVRPLLDRLSCLVDALRDFGLGFDSLENKITLPSCFEQFSSLDRQLSSAERTVRNTRNISPSRAQNLVSDVEDVQSTIRQKESELQDAGCFDEFRNRANSLLNRVDRKAKRAIDIERPERPQVERPEVITCESEFPSIDQDVTRLEQRTINLQAPVSNERLQSIFNDADGILRDIQNQVDDSQCIREFRDRVNRAVNRASELRGRVRITIRQEAPDAPDEPEQELLESINERLQQLSEREVQEAPGLQPFNRFVE